MFRHMVCQVSITSSKSSNGVRAGQSCGVVCCSVTCNTLVYGDDGVVVYCKALLRGLDSTVGDEFFFRRREYGFAAGILLRRIEKLFEGRLIRSSICFLDACGRC